MTNKKNEEYINECKKALSAAGKFYYLLKKDIHERQSNNDAYKDVLAELIENSFEIIKSRWVGNEPTKEYEEQRNLVKRINEFYNDKTNPLPDMSKYLTELAYTVIENVMKTRV